ncbi:alpha/beta hydrolase [Rudanella lutea]|uniref:alpha/beta hydrolase n=1 Tax=Rudanella lutea TaxID=451374 RepID=UPI0005C566A7|nr:alpha/beta hydrolase [Rudanella lutea]
MLPTRFMGALPVALIVLVLLIVTAATGWARPSKRTRDIPYLAPNTAGFDPERHLLDVYQPRRKPATPRPVVVFIHGGSWNSGSKNMYWFIGRRLAKQGFVAVIINYRLAPAVEVPAMADDCARAVGWVASQIGAYGGDPSRIYVMGHSAGGGLAALLASGPTVFTRNGLPAGLVKGAVLNDPAGINMYDYLQKMEYPDDRKFLIPFGKEPAGWQAVSPQYQVQVGASPMLLYTGGRTYPSIIKGTEEFHQTLQKLGVQSQYRVIPRKKHVPMVTGLFWKNNIMYRDLRALAKP